MSGGVNEILETLLKALEEIPSILSCKGAPYVGRFVEGSLDKILPGTIVARTAVLVLEFPNFTCI